MLLLRSFFWSWTVWRNILIIVFRCWFLFVSEMALEVSRFLLGLKRMVRNGAGVDGTFSFCLKYMGYVRLLSGSVFGLKLLLGRLVREFVINLLVLILFFVNFLLFF